MTTGQLIFCCGIGLLILTIIIGIIFWIKKPQYIPENAVYHGTDGKSTQKLRSGYPTDRLTVRRERPSALDAAPLRDETELLMAERTEPIPGTNILPNTEVLDSQQAEKLEAGTEVLPVETVPLAEGSVSSTLEGTVPLSSLQETIPLAKVEGNMIQTSFDDIEEGSETMPLAPN